MKASWLPIIIFMFLGCVAKNQPSITLNPRDYFILNKTIQLMEMDHLGNIYLVDDSDQLIKFDTTGQLLHTVVNNNLGHIHSVDVGNPFKIMVFYRDQQTVVLYDRTLSEIQRIPLIQWDLHDVTAVNLSPDNALWLFNGESKVLMKMSDKGDPILTSDPFDIIASPSARPDFIYDADHFLLIKEKGKPIAVFNDFGGYVNTLDNMGEYFTIVNNTLIFPSEMNIRFYKPVQQEFTAMPIGERITDQRVYYYNGRFYIPDEKGIYIKTPQNR
ncbi:MAG TPA: hypothetical protein VMZ69_00190 [Saprospiraceae bacterium]|nr:hypothetical protein [Saprospiraceae bacterium]